MFYTKWLVVTPLTLFTNTAIMAALATGSLGQTPAPVNVGA
jgi:hypothetical protein